MRKRTVTAGATVFTLVGLTLAAAPGGGAAEVQDSYQLKKSNNSASLGVGAIGSVSLPFTSGNDSMVKVGSVTISSDEFYEGFFDLVSRYLATVDDLPLGAR